MIYMYRALELIEILREIQYLHLHTGYRCAKAKEVFGDDCKPCE